MNIKIKETTLEEVKDLKIIPAGKIGSIYLDNDTINIVSSIDEIENLLIDDKIADEAIPIYKKFFKKLKKATKNKKTFIFEGKVLLDYLPSGDIPQNYEHWLFIKSDKDIILPY